MSMEEMTWVEFLKHFPGFRFSNEDMQELMSTGYVAVGVGDGGVFTVRLEVAESDIPEMDFTKAEVGKFYRKK